MTAEILFQLPTILSSWKYFWHHEKIKVIRAALLENCNCHDKRETRQLCKVYLELGSAPHNFHAMGSAL